MMNKLADLLNQFKKKSKDYVFLVNEDVKASVDSDQRLNIKIKKSLELIFDHYIEPSDRLSIMSYGQNTRKMFKLVTIE